MKTRRKTRKKSLNRMRNEISSETIEHLHIKNRPFTISQEGYDLIE
jgi:hypothetical protein